jgi:hypothetical protein
MLPRKVSMAESLIEDIIILNGWGGTGRLICATYAYISGGAMSLAKKHTDPPPSRLLQEAEEILRRDLAVAHRAYLSATPQERALARRNYLNALSRFAGLVMDNRIPDDLQPMRSDVQ